MKKIIYTFLVLLAVSANAQNIRFTFENAQITNDGVDDFYEVDVMIESIDGQPDFKLGIGQLYINYSETAFDSSVSLNGNLEITYDSEYILGQSNGFPYYSDFVVNDNTPSRFSFAYQQGLSSGSMENNVTNVPAKLFHIKMKYQNSMINPQISFQEDETSPAPLGVSDCRDQFFTACGPSSGGLNFDDCATFPGEQFFNAVFDSEQSTLSYFEKSKNDVFFLSPNPFSNYLRVNSTMNATFAIFDISGKNITNGSLNTGVNNINLSNLESGLYLMEIKSQNVSSTKKIIKR